MLTRTRMPNVNRLLNAATAGDRHASAEILTLVYDELRKLAAARMAAEPPDQTLQPTALVHEAYLRLIGPADDPRWESRGHFFAAAAEAMRRVLVDAARRKRTDKHGGLRRRVELPDPPVAAEAAGDADDELLGELRYFAGLSVEDAATVLGLSRATAYRHWSFARAWLLDAVRAGGPG